MSVGTLICQTVFQAVVRLVLFMIGSFINTEALAASYSWSWMNINCDLSAELFEN